MHYGTTASEIHLEKLRDSTLTSLELFQIYCKYIQGLLLLFVTKEQIFVAHTLYLYSGSLKIDIQNGAGFFRSDITSSCNRVLC